MRTSTTACARVNKPKILRGGYVGSLPTIPKSVVFVTSWVVHTLIHSQHTVTLVPNSTIAAVSNNHTTYHNNSNVPHTHKNETQNAYTYRYTYSWTPGWGISKYIQFLLANNNRTTGARREKRKSKSTRRQSRRSL